MSTIAAKKEDGFIDICCDSRISYGTERKDSSVGGSKIEKILKVNESLYFGCVGDAFGITALEIFSKTRVPEDSSKKSILDYSLSFRKFLKDDYQLPDICLYGFIVINEKIYEINWHMGYFSEIDKFCAYGTGREFAISALHLGKSCSESVELACKLDSYSEGDIIKYKIFI